MANADVGKMVERRWSKSAYARAQRKQRVAALAARGFEGIVIWEILSHGERALVNPETGREWSTTTIYDDLTSLREDALQRAARDTEAWRAEQLEQLSQVRNAAWGAGALQAVLAAVALEAKLTGTDRHDIRVIQQSLDVNVEDLSDDELRRIAAGEDPIAVLSGRSSRGTPKA